MKEIKINVKGKEATACVIEMGPFNLVLIKTAKGMIGCGAFDVKALEKFSYPAVKIKSTDGSPVKDEADFLKGIAVEVNSFAKERGIEVEMPGKNILQRQ